jgi:hypothetical protein
MYKFTHLNQTEVKAILGLNLTEEPRAIREAKAEGRETVREEGVIGIVTQPTQALTGSGHIASKVPANPRPPGTLPLSLYTYMQNIHR